MKSPELVVPMGAYFYPNSTSCPVRAGRAREFGVNPWDDTLEAQKTEPLYEGHDQPRTYSIAPRIYNWDDADPEAIRIQSEMARDYGIDFFVYNTYVGNREGKDATELDKPLKALQEHGDGIGLAPMLVLGASRVRLPAPNRYALDYPEPGRNFDLDSLSIERMVDFCADNYWDKDWTVNVGGRPYVSVLGTSMLADRPAQEQVRYFTEFVEQFRTLAEQKYKVDPYLVRVEKSIAMIQEMQSTDFDAFTGYALLPDFQNSREEPVQDYQTLIQKREQEWFDLAESSPSTVFVPPAVVGWDSSPRGMNGHTLEEVRGNYPFTPIVDGASADSFSDMLAKVIGYTAEHVPPSEQYHLVCAWNEVGEACALLPRVIDGELDFSFLESIKRARNNLNATIIL